MKHQTGRVFVSILLVLGLLVIGVSLSACGGEEATEEAATEAPAGDDGGGEEAAESEPAEAESESAQEEEAAETTTEEESAGESEAESAAETEAESEAAEEAEAEESASGDMATIKAETLTGLNLRGGPGTNYAVVGGLPAGAEITLVGRNEAGDWLVVRTEEGEEAWLSGDPEFIKYDEEAVADLPEVETPTLSYNAGDPKVNQFLNEIPLVVYHESSYTCASHGGLNYLFDVADGNVIGPHSQDFIYQGDNVLFKYQNGALYLIKENPVARFEGDRETLTFAEAMQAVANGDLIWNGTMGEWPAKGVPGCDPNANP